jgi:hypothetical protein
MKDPKQLAEDKFAEMSEKFPSLYSEENKQLFTIFFMDGFFEGALSEREKELLTFEKIFN